MLKKSRSERAHNPMTLKHSPLENPREAIVFASIWIMAICEYWKYEKDSHFETDNIMTSLDLIMFNYDYRIIFAQS